MYIGVMGFKISGCDIRHQLCAERVVIARRPGRANGNLDVEVAPALSGGDRRGDIVGIVRKWLDADRRLPY
jgi:hypothetical protein